MHAIDAAIRRRVKAFARHRLGVHLSREAPPPANKHADHMLAALRRWTSRDVVFDVGANDGRTVLRLHGVLGEPRVHAFEPVASTYQTLVRRTAHLPHIRAHHLALGAEPGRATMHLNTVDAMNSFSPDWTDAPIGTEEVEVSTVDRIMSAERIDFIHFLKVDTEGHEMEVLRGAEQALRESRVGAIQLEVGFDQLRKRMLSLEEARAHLSERGYYLQGIYNQCRTQVQPPPSWPASERASYRPAVLAYCDALFIGASLP